MGNINVLAGKLKIFLTDGQNEEKFTYFQAQQRMLYSKQIGRKCLEHMIDISEFVHLETLKKVHKYLHPVIKYIQYCDYMGVLSQDNQQNENFISIHQQQLISSAANVLQMYCVYLSRVVPANISYFHFMREKDFYIHYNALKYVLQIGQVSSLFKSSARSLDIFSRLSIENRLAYIKLISHWLYDMVKYKCSAVYLESSTLPYLIVMNAIVLCGLLNYEKINLLQEYRRKEKTDATKNTIYQHTLYALTFILSQCHLDKREQSTQGNGCIQIILLGIAKLINMMWKDYEKSELSTERKKTMYAPSYWYVESLQYVAGPQLENIIFRLILDMMEKRNLGIEGSKVNGDRKGSGSEILEQMKKKMVGQKTQQKYEIFEDEQENDKPAPSQKLVKKKLSHQSLVNQNFERSKQTEPKPFQFKDPEKIFSQNPNIQSEQMMRIPNNTKSQAFHKYHPINNLTEIIFQHCLICILQYFPQLAQIQKLQRTLVLYIKNLSPDSFIRPYILGIINFIKYSKREETKSQEDLTKDKNTPKILPELEEYCKNNQMDYSTQHYIIPYQTVGRNCSIFLNKLFPKILQTYYMQTSKSDGEIWGQVLKYNTHQFRQKYNK